MAAASTDIELTMPFLRWTGSKRWLIKDHLKDLLPQQFNNYHEPFLGGGSVFFHIKSTTTKLSRKYFLSDSNEELINCYEQLRDNLPGVLAHLKKHKNTEEEYYKIREYKPRALQQKAARFIYLNRTSFNGIYRVNSDGKYNVPYGNRTQVDVITKSQFESVNTFLKNVNIKKQSFEKGLKTIKKGDLVFIDPPYTVAHENNGFIEYNQKLFSWKDQERLKKYVLKLNEIGAFFILTNASHSSLTKLYDSVGEIKTLSRLSQVGGRNQTRGLFNEIVVFNTKST